jgi:hypothetical protein
VGDGFAPVTVASRFGTFTLRRQVLEPSDGSTHRIPGNAYVPPHQSISITRGLQEWACLLPQDLSFATASRLLGWQPQPEPLRSDTTIRTLVRQHGQALREAEHAEALDLLQRADLATLTPALTTSQPPRGRAAWPPELADAVAAALDAGAERAPEGVTAADWARVLARHQQEPERSVAQLRTLGPQVQPDEVLVVPDEVCTRKTSGGFWELRTARVSTSAGTRYVSGTGASFLTVLLVLVLLCAGRDRRLLVVADGARWIRAWAAQLTERWPKTQLLLDWFHLRKRCSEWGSMACLSGVGFLKRWQLFRHQDAENNTHHAKGVFPHHKAIQRKNLHLRDTAGLFSASGLLSSTRRRNGQRAIRVSSLGECPAPRLRRAGD